MSRYTNFAASMVETAVDLHPESAIMWSIGPTVADNQNDGASALRGSGQHDWLWILGDDHTWARGLLPAMLRRMYRDDLDVLVPLCFKRSWPPSYVVYDRFENGVAMVIKSATVGEILTSGDWTREVVAAGTAGMLIRGRVIEALEPPYFQNGLVGDTGEVTSQAGEDLNFCTLVRAAGFKIHCAFDFPFGHITQVSLYPEWAEEIGHFGMRMVYGREDGPFIALAEAPARQDA